MRRLGWAVFVLAATAQVGRSQDALPAVSAARVTLQVAAGAVLTPIGFFGTGWAAKRIATRTDWPEGRIQRTAYVAAFTGAAAATAAAPALIGDRGRYGVAFLGAAAGIATSALTARLGNARYDGGVRCGPLCLGLGALTISLPSIGATLAYNASRR